MMPEPNNPPSPDAFERFDEAQPFLQLLADMLNRLVSEQTEPKDESAEVTEEPAG
jgi:hypothetical protein